MREYVISFSNITVLGATTLIFLRPGTSAALELTRAEIGQNANATSAMQRVQFVSQVAAFPTLVAATPAKTQESDPISLIVGGTAGAAGTCGVNASAEGAGAKSVLREFAPWNVLNGFLWLTSQGDRQIISPSSASGFGLFFPSAPLTLTGWSGNLVFREIG